MELGSRATTEATGAQLLEVLRDATSQNHVVLKDAEHRLRAWECESGFYRALTEVFSNPNVDLTLRWMAVLYFKNGVDRYWRKTAPNAIPESEKHEIREALLSSMAEPASQIAIQKAVVISKIARLDCPKEWVELYPTLMSFVHSRDGHCSLAKTRALEVMAMTTKAMASKRLAGDRRLFKELASDIFIPLVQELDSVMNQYYASIKMGLSPVAYLEQAKFCMKTLRHVCVQGISPIPCNADLVAVRQFVLSLFPGARKFLETGAVDHQQWEKFLVLMMKIPADILEVKPYVFVEFISEALNFCWHYICEDNAVAPKKLIVQCFNLMKGILLCTEYKMGGSRGAAREFFPASADFKMDMLAEEALGIRDEFFVKERVDALAKKLIGSYFPLTDEEIKQWMDDPEGFARDDAGETSKYSLRASVECLFTALMHEYTEIVGNTVIELYSNPALMIPADPNDFWAVLTADAVYRAVGLAAFHLFDVLDFETWLSSTLFGQLKVQHPHYKVLKDRIIWLIGRWIVVRIRFEMRPALYEEILPFIGGTGGDDLGDNGREVAENDVVVRLQAANTLKLAVDDFEFNVEQFLPYLEPTFLRLFVLLQEVKECDTKLRVLHVMSFVVERVGVNIKPFLSGLVDYLPRLWNEAVDHQMLKASIVSTLVHIVDSIGRDSGSLYSFLLSIVQASTDASSPDHVYLLEDGLDLWLAVLKNAPEPKADLIAIYQRNMPALLELSGETLLICLKIVMSYVYLCPEEFVNQCGASLSEYLLNAMPEMNREGMLACLRVAELLIRALPSEAPPMMRSLIEWILADLLSRGETSSSAMITALEFAILSRALLFCPDLMQAIAHEMALCAPDRASRGDPAFQWALNANAPGSSAFIWATLLDLWISKFSLYVSSAKRKTMALAMASMLRTRERVILERFCGILLCICETMNDAEDTDDLTCIMDNLAIKEPSSESPSSLCEDETWMQHESPQDERKRMMARNDPIFTLSLRDFAQKHVNLLKELLGLEQFQILLTSVDSEICSFPREMDITLEFKACVKVAKLGSGGTKKPNKCEREKSDFERRARELVDDISKLKEFLLRNRRGYLNSAWHGTCEGLTTGVPRTQAGLTDSDRDEIDAWCSALVKGLRQSITGFRKNVAFSSSANLQTRQHREAVVHLIDGFLKTVCDVYSELRALRVKRTVERRGIARLALRGQFGLRRRKNLPPDSQDPLQANESPKKPMIISQNVADFEDADSAKESEELSPAELQVLESENISLMNRLHTMKNEVQQIEGKVLKIAQLQEVFTKKVLEQEKDIEVIGQAAIRATENVVEGNEQVREAMKKNAGLRVWILFFFLIMSFAILFLDWYNV
ncbi:unnamed protein product [Notodromas monacha]|uniref:Importin N-terminal domain-containing protein n=1 Tax=Notodromas monacha TaxID=399045 RepID=A0A7R9BMB6_9CRUS|nr:unnamed protein product [Notodromas monacha]CAG0916642.1 unnamed protein product [Notodromas monacha]